MSTAKYYVVLVHFIMVACSDHTTEIHRYILRVLVITLTEYNGKRNVTVWRTYVRLPVCPSAYSP